MSLLKEKQTIMDYNTSLVQTIGSLQQSGPSVSIIGMHNRQSGSNFPQDVPELIEEYTRIKAEQKCYMIKIQKLENERKLHHELSNYLKSNNLLKNLSKNENQEISVQKLHDLEKENSELKV